MLLPSSSSSSRSQKDSHWSFALTILCLCGKYSYKRQAILLDVFFFISREADDICRMLVEGMIGLLSIYRDFYSTPMLYPLLPWLHSTEPCEHSFGCMRQVVKDFSIIDFHSMIEKLRFKIREAVLLAEACNPRAIASGYNYSYVDSSGIDFGSLVAHIRDPDIPVLADVAMQKAESVISLLGLVPSLVQSGSPAAPVLLPSISSWLPNESESDEISDVESDDELDSENEGSAETATLQVTRSLRLGPTDSQRRRTNSLATLHRRQRLLQSITFFSCKLLSHPLSDCSTFSLCHSY